MKKKNLTVIFRCILLLVCGTFAICVFSCGNRESGGNNGNGGNNNGGVNNNGGGEIDDTHTHTMINHPAQAPSTCVGTGNYEYWECTGCGKYFYDSDGICEYTDKSDIYFVTKHNLYTAEHNEPTCTEKGNIAFWQCLSCGKCFTDRQATNLISGDDVWIPALGHDYVSHAAATARCNISGWNDYHTCTRCSYTTQVKFHAPHNYLSNTYICQDKCGTNLIITEGLEYRLSDDEQSYVVSGIGTATTNDIVIPYTYNGKPVMAIRQQAFQRCESITSVVIPNSVTSIGNYAFEDCKNMKNVEIPSSVTSIGWLAFSGCSSLEYVVIPNGVTIIEYSTFSRCGNLKSIEIPSTVTTIDRSALEYCGNLVRIDFVGTKSQWDAISKLDHWDSMREKEYFVYCSDRVFTAYGKNV